jgi:hypothetical protein
MNQLPFSVYDFLGYLASGAVVLAGLTVSFVGYEPLQQSPSLPVGLLLVIAAYVIGQIVANLAGDLIERRLVANRLHRPTDILLGFHVPDGLTKWLLPGYCTPLPGSTRDRVRNSSEGLEGGALFFHCHAVMKSDSVVRERLETFLNLYGFCRNMSLALVIVAACLGGGLVIGSADTGPVVAPGWWLAAAALAALGMLYRYLKFYRQYALELLTSYAERRAA